MNGIFDQCVCKFLRERLNITLNINIFLCCILFINELVYFEINEFDWEDSQSLSFGQHEVKVLKFKA